MQPHIASTVRSCFKRTKLTPATLTILAQSLYFVAIGIRASQLIDYYCSPDQATDLITMLRQHRDCNELVLLQFSDRYTFIGHRQRLMERCTEYSATGGEHVDVQGKIPVKLDRMPEDVDRFVTQQLEPYLQGPDALMVVPTLPCFMVALTGWLLEYPVVYVCHQVDEVLDEWEPRGNCLGNLPLEWIQIQIRIGQQGHPLLSFTFPSHLFDKDMLVAQVRDKFASRLDPSMSLALVQETVSLDRVAL